MKYCFCMYLKWNRLIPKPSPTNFLKSLAARRPRLSQILDPTLPSIPAPSDVRCSLISAKRAKSALIFTPKAVKKSCARRKLVKGKIRSVLLLCSQLLQEFWWNEWIVRTVSFSLNIWCISINYAILVTLPNSRSQQVHKVEQSS